MGSIMIRWQDKRSDWKPRSLLLPFPNSYRYYVGDWQFGDEFLPTGSSKRHRIVRLTETSYQTDRLDVEGRLWTRNSGSFNHKPLERFQAPGDVGKQDARGTYKGLSLPSIPQIVW